MQEKKCRHCKNKTEHYKKINSLNNAVAQIGENQKLIDFLNMSVGDQKYINEFKNGTTGYPLADLNYEYETNTIYSTLGLFFKNTTKSKNYYNYNGFIAQLLFNYVKHNTGEDFQKILNKV